MLQVERGVLEISQQANLDKAVAGMPISLHSPREGQVTPLALRECARNARSWGAVAQVRYGEIVLLPGDHIRAARLMPGNRYPGFNVLRCRERVKQASNLSPDTEFKSHGPRRG